MIQVSRNHACVAQSERFYERSYERSGIAGAIMPIKFNVIAPHADKIRDAPSVRGILQRTHLGWASASALQSNRGPSVAGNTNYPQAGPGQARKNIKSEEPKMG